MLRIYPPEGFSVDSCYLQVKAMVRARTKSCEIRKTRSGYFALKGPLPETLLLKPLLTRYGYEVSKGMPMRSVLLD
jgi:hypothetical protein